MYVCLLYFFINNRVDTINTQRYTLVFSDDSVEYYFKAHCRNFLLYMYLSMLPPFSDFITGTVMITEWTLLTHTIVH